MRKKRYGTLDELYDELNANQKKIVQKLQKIFLSYEGVQEVLQRNSYVYKFPNGTWWYLDTYKKIGIVLGCGHAVRLIKKEPILRMAFDEVKKVVGKVFLDEVGDVDKKRVEDLVVYTANWSK